jgi:hypothetical protein
LSVKPFVAALAAVLVMAAPALAAPRYSIDTRIQDLMANPAAKAVVEKTLPKLQDNPHYFIARFMTVRQLAKQTGQIPAARLQAMDAALAKVK